MTTPTPKPGGIGHPTTDPGDGRKRCDGCGKYVWQVIHSCRGGAQPAPKPGDRIRLTYSSGGTMDATVDEYGWYPDMKHVQSGKHGITVEVIEPAPAAGGGDTDLREQFACVLADKIGQGRGEMDPKRWYFEAELLVAVVAPELARLRIENEGLRLHNKMHLENNAALAKTNREIADERDEARAQLANAVVLPDDWRDRLRDTFGRAWHYESARGLVEALVESWPTASEVDAATALTRLTQDMGLHNGPEENR